MKRLLHKAMAVILTALVFVNTAPYVAVVFAAVTLGNTATGETAPTASTLSTGAFTVTGGAGSLLVCGVGYTDGGQQPTGLAWDAAGVNQALTQIKRERESVNTGLATDLWVKYSPTGGTSKTVTVTMTGSITGWGVACAEFTGTDTSTPYGTPASADTESGPTDPVTCTPSDWATGDMSFNFMSAATSSTASVGTSFFDSTGSGIQLGASTKGSTGALQWTKDGGGTQHWSSSCVAVHTAGGGGGGATPRYGLVLGVGEHLK